MRQPSHLDKTAKTYWKKLSPLVAQSPRNSELLGILCIALSEHRQAQAFIDKHGIVVNGCHGGWVKNPAIQVRDKAISIIHKLSTELLKDVAIEGDELDKLLGED